jgi:hypothetical protein
MNADYTITNHERALDDMHYRPLNKVRVTGALSDIEVLQWFGTGARIIKRGTTSHGYVRLIHIV